MLAPIVRERARVLAPATLVSLAVFVIGAGPFGLRPDDVSYACVIAVLVALAVVTAGVLLGKVPRRLDHLVPAFVLWCPMIAASIAMYSTNNYIFALFFIVLAASTGTMLDRTLVFATLLGIAAIAIPMILRCHGPYPGMFIGCLVMASMFAMLMHGLMRKALLNAERHRQAATDAAQQLAEELRARERLQDQLLHAQRMDAVGTLAAGVAHDMNNVLASISGFADLVRTSVAESGVRADVDQIIAQAERGAALTRGLLAFSRRGQYRKKVVRVETVIRDVLPLLARTLPKTIEIVDLIDVFDACVLADPVHLEQVLVNLGLNAADAMGGKGRLAITADLVVVGGVRQARLRISDSGVGMDAETRLRIFEPFFTTKPAGKGTGLGLSIVWGIVKAHDGAVDVESRPGAGATFTIHLPLTTQVPTVREMPRLVVEEKVSTRATTVLVVDDETAVRESTQRLIERMGLAVLTAADGEQALVAFRANAASIGLVILDMGMPVMGGAECFRKLREQSEVPVLIATGYAVEADVQGLVAAGAHIIEKPFAVAELRREVTRLVGAPDRAAS